ncbi:MAG TPA: hypothetical protein VJP40_06770, partial [bacterium]|nr:hypothetical protein [bacterium]
MHTIFICPPDGSLIETQDLEVLKNALEEQRSNVWVDIEEPSEDEVDFLLDYFNFHPLAIEHVLLGVGAARL